MLFIFAINIILYKTNETLNYSNNAFMNLKS